MLFVHILGIMLILNCAKIPSKSNIILLCGYRNRLLIYSRLVHGIITRRTLLLSHPIPAYLESLSHLLSHNLEWRSTRALNIRIFRFTTLVSRRRTNYNANDSFIYCVQKRISIDLSYSRFHVFLQLKEVLMLSCLFRVCLRLSLTHQTNKRQVVVVEALSLVEEWSCRDQTRGGWVIDAEYVSNLQLTSARVNSVEVFIWCYSMINGRDK